MILHLFLLVVWKNVLCMLYMRTLHVSHKKAPLYSQIEAHDEI